MKRIIAGLIVMACCVAVVSYCGQGRNGKRLLIIKGDSMSVPNQIKFMTKVALFTGDITNAWAGASSWRSILKPAQTAKMLNYDYDRLYVAGRRKKWQFEIDLIQKAYQWGTNNLGTDVKLMQVVIVDSGDWMTNQYTQINQ